jgi:hypothetical protein
VIGLPPMFSLLNASLRTHHLFCAILAINIRAGEDEGGALSMLRRCFASLRTRMVASPLEDYGFDQSSGVSARHAFGV